MNFEGKGQSPDSGPLSQNAEQERRWQTQTQNMAGVRTFDMNKAAGWKMGA